MCNAGDDITHAVIITIVAICTIEVQQDTELNIKSVFIRVYGNLVTAPGKLKTKVSTLLFCSLSLDCPLSLVTVHHHIHAQLLLYSLQLCKNLR